MINTVRNTVLSVLNKNNYGYLSPSDFNLFAKQAQLDIFESYFYQYNYQINKENARQSGSGIADLAKGIEESMDLFSVTEGLFIDTVGTAGSYQMPSDTTTGSDYYFVNKVLVYKSVITGGTTTAFALANQLIDTGGVDFNALGVVAGDIVAVQTSLSGVEYTTVVGVNVGGDVITLTGSIMDANGLSYSVIKAGTQLNEAEKVTHSKITMLNNSVYTSPTTTYPAYTSQEALLQVSPDTITSAGRVIAQYFRYPRDPNWTYSVVAGGEPIFNQSQPDYQDFELPLDDENNLVMKILQYAGVSIREADVYQFANGEETKENQQEA